MVSKKQKLKRELDKLIQDITRSTYTECLVCSNKRIVGHHFYQKSQSLFLRYDLRNIVPLCVICHSRHHLAGDPYIHKTILLRKGMKWADSLERDRRIIFKDTISNLLEVKSRLSSVE